MLDLHKVCQIFHAALPRHPAEQVAGDHAGACQRLLHALVGDRPEQRGLHDVAGGFVASAAGPCPDGKLEPAAAPPVGILPGQVGGKLERAAGGLADAVGGEETSLAVNAPSIEELDMLRVLSSCMYQY